MAPPFTGAGKGQRMAVNIRKAKLAKECTSCQSNGCKLFEIGFGGKHKTVVTLCNTCMHTLLQKMIIVGTQNNEVR